MLVTFADFVSWLSVSSMVISWIWKRKIMVQINPRDNLGLPSTISCEPIFSKCTLCSLKNCKALSTFSRQCIRIFPLVGLGSLSPERTSRSLIRFLPSRRSQYRSLMREFTRTKWELTHFWNVFFCTPSLSSVKRNLIQLLLFYIFLYSCTIFSSPIKECKKFVFKKMIILD